MKKLGGAASFNQPLNSWNVSNVTGMVTGVAGMSGMFLGATSFNQPLNSWNVSKVISMSEMFLGATSFNQPLDSWDVSNITNMQGMFALSSFNQPLNSWDVSKVKNMAGMFAQFEHFSKLKSYFNQFSGLKDWKISSDCHFDGIFFNLPQTPPKNWKYKNMYSLELDLDKIKKYINEKITKIL